MEYLTSVIKSYISITPSITKNEKKNLKVKFLNKNGVLRDSIDIVWSTETSWWRVWWIYFRTFQVEQIESIAVVILNFAFSADCQTSSNSEFTSSFPLQVTTGLYICISCTIVHFPFLLQKKWTVMIKW